MDDKEAFEEGWILDNFLILSEENKKESEDEQE